MNQLLLCSSFLDEKNLLMIVGRLFLLFLTDLIDCLIDSERS